MDIADNEQTRRIEALVSPTLEAMGYALVRVQISGTKRPKLRIMVERIDEKGMTVDDCTVISKELSPLFDVEDVVDSAYALEISSPGVDRPLVKRDDFDRFAGFDVKAELARPINNRRRFQGQLLGREADSDVVLIRLEDETARLPFDEIRQAKLVLTDELLAAHAGQEN